MMNKLRKLIRYIVTGYIFKLKAIRESLDVFVDENWECKKDYPKTKIVVYTVIFGEYDKIIEPRKLENIDYYIVTNQEISVNSLWKRVSLDERDYIKYLNDKDKSRYYKMHPEIIFPNYDCSIYIDGNIRIESDIMHIINKMQETNKCIGIHKHYFRDCIYEEGKAIIALNKAKFREVNMHLKKYKKEGFPKHFGLFENNIIIRYHNDDKCKAIMDLWWKEYINGCKRDQLSFAYCLWKLNLNCEFVQSLGSNSRKNPLFEIKSHLNY